MTIDLTAVLNGSTDVIELSYEMAPPEDFSDIHFDRPIKISGRVKNMAGYMRLTLDLEVGCKTHCVRCMKEISTTQHPLYERTLVRANQLNSDEGNEEYLVYKGKSFEPDEDIYEAIMVEIPEYPLCNEECKGLCPKCGTDLNEGSCNCTLKEEDPRLAILKKYLTNEQ